MRIDTLTAQARSAGSPRRSSRHGSPYRRRQGDSLLGRLPAWGRTTVNLALWGLAIGLAALIAWPF